MVLPLSMMPDSCVIRLAPEELDTGMGYSLTPAYHLLSTVIVMPEDTEELAGGQWQGNREHRLEIPTFHH